MKLRSRQTPAVAVAGEIHRPQDPLPNRSPEVALLERIRLDPGLVGFWQAANPNRGLAQTLRWGRNEVLAYHCDGIFAPLPSLPCLAAREALGDPWILVSDDTPVAATFYERIAAPPLLAPEGTRTTDTPYAARSLS